MVSGTPPRYSKTTDEPVTIDLEAEDTGRTTDSEKMMERASTETGSSSADEVEMPLEDEQPTATNAGSAGTENDVPKHAASEAPAQPSYSGATRISDEQKPKPAATSALVAAGIVGGLIALIGVGSIQYAGLLPGSSKQKDNSTEVAALSAEIDGLKQTVATLASAPPAKVDNSANAALEARVAALEAKPAAAPVSGVKAAPGDAANQQIADLGAQIDQLKTSLAQVTQDQASSGADMGKRLDDAEKKLNEPREDTAVARAIAAAALKAAIDRGGPFRPELDTFAGIAPDDPAVADLRNFADTGIPSRADLIRRVPDVANAIVAATQQPDESQSWSDRLMSSAKSLVRVRPVGNVEGDGVDAIAARFEDKVKNGDLPGAITEWNSLPEGARSASAAFKQSLDARIRVEDLVGEALSKAIAGAGKQN